MKKALATARAFTLIELLVVIAIIALLTGIILTALVSSKAKSRDAQRVSDLGQIQLALELYFDRCGQYPPPDTGGSLGSGSYIDLNTLNQNVGCPSGSNITLGSYISQIMLPPAGAGQPAYDYYVNASPATDYILHAKLEGTSSASPNGLSAVPSDITGASSGLCSNSPGSLDYCVGPK